MLLRTLPSLSRHISHSLNEGPISRVSICDYQPTILQLLKTTIVDPEIYFRITKGIYDTDPWVTMNMT